MPIFLRQHLLTILVCLLPTLGFTQTKQNKRYTIEIQDAPIQHVVRMLTMIDGQNVVMPDKMEGLVTASFNSISLQDALEAILETHGLGAVSKNKVIRIATKEALEELGEDLETTTFRLKYAKAKDVGGQVEALVSERGSVMIDDRINALTVRDTLPYLQDVQTLITNIDKLDKQVLIEAKIVEASVDYVRSLGVQWGFTDTAGEFQVAGLNAVGAADSGRTLNLNTSATGLGGANPTSGVALGLGPFGDTLFDTQLSLAEEKGDLSILSRPSIVTVNNQPATIHSGVKFFVKTSGDLTISASSSGSSTGTSNLQQIDAGITMIVTPQVTVDGKISLAIDVTESQPDFANTVDGIPSIIDNTAATTVFLNNGATTVIGGLFQLQKTKTKRGLPVLHRIPIFGALFGSTRRGTTKKELLVFITPSIVKEHVRQLSAFEEEDSEIMKELQK